MLEKLPGALGHVLIDQRAGLQKTAYWKLDLAEGLPSIELSSPAFENYGQIPATHTADGQGRSPPLAWRGVPAGTASLALIVEDADAPTPQPLVHAIVVELPAADGLLAEGALDDPQGDPMHLGRNSYLQRRWLPPDPPPGHGVHRYLFQLFALAPGEAWSSAPGRDELMEALAERALASGCLVGLYERTGSEKLPDAAPSAAEIGS